MIARKKVKRPSGVEVISNRYHRNNMRKNAVNRARRSMVRTKIKKFLHLLKQDMPQDELKKEYVQLQKVLMAKKSINVFNFKKCSRLFSRITKKVQALTQV